MGHPEQEQLCRGDSRMRQTDTACRGKLETLLRPTRLQTKHILCRLHSGAPSRMAVLRLKLLLLMAASVSVALSEEPRGGEEPMTGSRGTCSVAAAAAAAAHRRHRQPGGVLLKRVFLLGGEGGDNGRSSAETGGDTSAFGGGRVLHWRGEGAEAALDAQVDAEVWRAPEEDEDEEGCSGTGNTDGSGCWPREEPAFFCRGSTVTVIGELAWPLMRLPSPPPPPAADEVSTRHPPLSVEVLLMWLLP